MLTQNSSQELQWSQFIENEHSCLLESANKNLVTQKPIAIFSSFRELINYLKKNPDLLEIEELGFCLAMNYESGLCIQLYNEIREINDIQINKSSKKLRSSIQFPSKEKYIEAVKKCQEYIYEGDIYQANICHEFEVELKEDYALSEIKDFIYSRLRELNPSNYMAIAEFEDEVIFSSSPESLLKIEGQNGNFKLTSSPIKGTALLEESLEELKSSKEKAEHIMIVDLIRNDLSKISKAHCVTVDKLLERTKHTNLQHLVSEVEAQLKEELVLNIHGVEIPDFEAVFKAIFPGGSITGTPKLRSMQIIKELESSNRGFFTGSLGYYKFKKRSGEFNILIRSIFYDKKTHKLSFNTGAGITSASDPLKEYEETMLKAEKLIEVFDND